MLEIQGLSFSYDETEIFSDFNFTLASGNIASILGESGSGKSTLLKLIYGLYDWQAGTIFFEKVERYGPKANLVPGESDMKWVSQEFDLMPYTTVGENVGEFLSNIQLNKKKERVDELIEVVDMQNFRDTKVKFLSGGQKQRVALAKALSTQPRLLLLDEPFSQIDNFRTRKLQRELFTFLKKEKISAIMTTHSYEDALSFSDELHILKGGKILESGKPEDIYFEMKNPETARLLGDINRISGETLGLKNENYFVRPEEISVSEKGYMATVLHSYFQGSRYLIEADWDGKTVFLYHSERKEQNSKIHFSINLRKP